MGRLEVLLHMLILVYRGPDNSGRPNAVHRSHVDCTFPVTVLHAPDLSELFACFTPSLRLLSHVPSNFGLSST